MLGLFWQLGMLAGGHFGQPLFSAASSTVSHTDNDINEPKIESKVSLG